MKTKLPTSITPALLDLCQQVVGPDHAGPFFVDITPEVGAIPNQCHVIIEQLISQKGGEQVFGWSLWEFYVRDRLAWVEAQFHSLWRSPDGQLVDPTPDEDNELQRLFVCDPNRRFQGHAIPKQYWPQTDNPLILEALVLFRQAEALHVTYKYGDLLSQADAARLLSLRQKASILLMGFPTTTQLPLTDVPSKTDPNWKRNRHKILRKKRGK